MLWVRGLAVNWANHMMIWYMPKKNISAVSVFSCVCVHIYRWGLLPCKSQGFPSLSLSILTGKQRYIQWCRRSLKYLDTENFHSSLILLAVYALLSWDYYKLMTLLNFATWVCHAFQTNSAEKTSSSSSYKFSAELVVNIVLYVLFTLP